MKKLVCLFGLVLAMLGSGCSAKESANKGRLTTSLSANQTVGPRPSSREVDQTNSSSDEKVALQSSSETQTAASPNGSHQPIEEAVLNELEVNVTAKDGTDSRLLTDDGLRVMLSVRPQLQEVWHYCAPTTVSMMLSSRGVAVDQHQLAKEMGTYEPWGTHNRDAIRILNRHLFGYELPEPGQDGYRLETVTNAGPEELQLFKERLRQNIADGYPLYYTVDVAKLYPGLKGEHNVIGIGYELTADGQDIANVYYLDPSPNVQDPTYGGLKKLSPQELLTAMVTCVEPNYAW